MSGEKKLAIAVLANALETFMAGGGDDPSLAYFLQGGGLFTFWCDVAGFDPEPAVEKGKDLVAKLQKGEQHEKKS